MLNTERIALPVTAGLKQAAKEAAEREGRTLANFCRVSILSRLPDDLYFSVRQSSDDAEAVVIDGSLS